MSKLHLDVTSPTMPPLVSLPSCFWERNPRNVNIDVSSPLEDILQPFNDPRVAVMVEPRFRPSLDITGNFDEFDSDTLGEPASLSTSDVFLPQVLGQESFELELFTHQMYLAPGAPSPKSISNPFEPPNGRSNTTVSDISGRISPPIIRRWFRRPYYPDFLVHLLDLYFCWIHPSYQIFSREHFLHDFQSGQTNYCSRTLVNAVAAFACSYSDRMAALADPHDPSTAGDQFFAEAERLLQHGSESPLMLALALSIMSSRELACGRTFTSQYYAGKCQSVLCQLAPPSIPSTDVHKGMFDIRRDVSPQVQIHLPGCG